MRTVSVAFCVFCVFCVFVGSVGCFVAPPDPEAQLECAGDGDCPGDFVCAAALGLCKPANGERTPPKLDGVTLNAGPYAPGAAIHAVFAIDEGLARLPVVLLQTDTAVAFVVAADNVAGAGFVADVTAPAGDGNVDVVADLVDRAGNTARVSLGSVRLDATAPALVSATIDGPAVLGPNALTSRLQVVFDEDVVNVTASQGGSGLDVVVAGATVDVAVDASAIADADRGAAIDVRVVDAAGNVGTASFDGFDFDFDAPVATVDAPAAARAGDNVVVLFLADEPVRAATAHLVTADGTDTALTAEIVGGLRVTLRFAVDDLAADGAVTVFLDSLEDAVGNVGGAASLVIDVDRTAPALISDALVAPDRIGATGEFAVSADASEDLADAALFVGGFAVVDACAVVSGDSVVCGAGGADLRADLRGSGVLPVALLLTDIAGNTRLVDAGVLTVDVEGPRAVAAVIARDPSFAPAARSDAAQPLFSRRDPLSGEFVTAIVTLLADEDVDDDLALVADDGVGFACVLDSARSGECSRVLDDVIAAGDHPLTLSWTDDLGNQRSEVLGVQLRLRDDVPTLDGEQVLLRRAPWGRPGDDSTNARVDVEGAAGATDGVQLLVLSEQGALPQALLAKGDVNVDGSFATDVAGDRGAVKVVAVSDAGVSSAVVDVVRVAWTATLGNKRIGSTLENPHTFGTRPVMNDHALDDPEVEGDGTRLFAADGNTVTSTLAPSWRLNPVPVSGLQGRIGAYRMAFDPTRGALFALEGGGRTFQSDGFTWRELPRVDAEGDGFPGIVVGVAYSGVRGALVAYDGAAFWSFDGRSWARLADVDNQIPPLKSGFTVAAGPDGSVVVVGGCNNASCGLPGVADVGAFVFDGARAVAVAGPPARNDAFAVYDPVRDVTVVGSGATVAPACGPNQIDLFASNVDRFCQFIDTWEFDGTAFVDRGATNMPRTVSAPGFDPESGDLVAVGSNDTSGKGRLARFDGSTWTLGAILPIPRPFFPDTAATDLRSGVLKFASLVDDDTGILPDFAVFAFHSTRFDLEFRRGADSVDAVPSPPERFETAVALDPLTKKPFMVGGRSRNGQGVCGVGGTCEDEWRFDGVSFNQMTPATKPPARATSAMAFDSIRNRTFLFGGAVEPTNASVQDTWQWDGVTWTQRCLSNACGALPPARARHGMAFDDVNGVSYVFGGEASFFGAGLNDTWQFNGTTWAECKVGGAVCNLVVGADGLPPPRADVGMVYDPDHDEVVLFGGRGAGFSRFGDTWTFKNNTWTRRATTGPAARTEPNLVFHPGLGVLLIGGQTNGVVDPIVWRWDGATWTPLATIDPEFDGDVSNRSATFAAFDGAQTVVWSGIGAVRFQSWLLDDHKSERPGHVFRVRFDVAGAGDAAIDDIDVGYVGSASDAAGNDGVDLALWRQDSFVSLSGVTADNGAVGWSSAADTAFDDADEVARVFSGPGRVLAVAARPRGNGGTVVSDSIFVTVSYRRVLP